MDLLKALAQTFDHTTEVLQRVTPDQLGLPTPCSEWDVRTVISHSTSVVVNMGRAARGDKPLPDANPVALETDLGTQFRGHADRTLMAWRGRGLDGEIDIDDQGCACERLPLSAFDRATYCSMRVGIGTSLHAVGCGKARSSHASIRTMCSGHACGTS